MCLNKLPGRNEPVHHMKPRDIYTVRAELANGMKYYKHTHKVYHTEGDERSIQVGNG